MDQTVEVREHRVSRVFRRSTEWTLREHEVVVPHWPDVDQIARRLPHRSATPIRHFAGRCNLRKPVHFWTPEQTSVLRKRVAEGVPGKLIATELGLKPQQVASRMRHMGLTYPRRAPKPSGNALVDSVRQRAFDLNISMKDLDEACRSGCQFACHRLGRGIHIKHIIKAAKVLDGEICIRWSEL